MTPADKTEFSKILMGLSAIKPGKDLTADGMALFWNSMQHWTIAEFRQAAQHLARSCEFMPNPFHFEQLRSRASAQAAGDAWANVVQVNRYGRIGREQLLTPRIERIVAAMGGWQALAMARTDELQWREKRFNELWNEFGDAESAAVALPHLAARAISAPVSAAALLERVQ